MTLVRARYFPAQVRLPDGRELRKAYVVLAEGGDNAGMTIYNQPDRVAYHGDVDWGATPALPKTERAAKNGVDIVLADGALVVLTVSAGCRCGPLGRWSGPGWATAVAARA